MNPAVNTKQIGLQQSGLRTYKIFMNIFFAKNHLYKYHSIILTIHVNMNNALRRFLHNHGNIATEGSPKPGLCPTLISNDFKGSL